MTLCATWPSLPFIDSATDGNATLHKKHTVRLNGLSFELTVRLRLCGAPLRCKGLSYAAHQFGAFCATL